MEHGCGKALIPVTAIMKAAFVDDLTFFVCWLDDNGICSFQL